MQHTCQSTESMYTHREWSELLNLAVGRLSNEDNKIVSGQLEIRKSTN